jgi:hypothetical protein
MKKYSLEGLTDEALESAKNINEIIDAIQALKNNSEVDGLKAKIDSLNIKDYSEEIASLKASLEAQGVELAKKQVVTEKENVSIAKAIVNMFEEKGLKSLSDLKALKGEEIELKADNPLIASNMTGTYGLTQQISNLRMPPVRPYAFLNNGIRVGSVSQDKNIILWVTGSRTSNVAYIGELADADSTVDGSTMVAAEKTRALSGIVGRAIITQRSFEDLSQLAQRIESGLLEDMNLDLDNKILNGAGNDSTKPNEIYGVLTNQVTAFDASLVPSVDKANVADLADAAALQAKLSYHTCNTVWMSETLAFKLQRTKDTSGQYIINKLVDGTMMMGGLKVITTELFGGATEKMLVGDPAKIQFWVKRALSAEFERVPKSDSWNLYVYARQQVLVEDEDIKGLIYISNVDTALAAIDSAQA